MEPITSTQASLSRKSSKIDLDQLLEIALDTYVYAYPLVIMEITRRVGTNSAKIESMRGPMNQFAHARAFPDASFTSIVRANADTLYSPLFYDVSKEPLIFTIPDSQGRYYLMQFLDMWTDVFASPGSRTTGDQKQVFALVGPKWVGKLPEGVSEIRSPTAMGFLIGRTQTNGKSDYDAVHRFQNGMQVVPLSAYGKPYTAPQGTFDSRLDMSAPSDQLERMSADVFFSTFVKLLEKNPPHANDYSMLERMKRIGIEPEKHFSFGDASPDIQKALHAAVSHGLKKIKGVIAKSGIVSNGWRINLFAIGTYGTDYLHRAAVAYAGLGANPIEDAIYPLALTDSDGSPFQSDGKYLIHFEKDEIPPVRAFWSLTLYNDKQLFADNPLNRYAIGDRDALKFNSDGSLDLYLQRESPVKDKESNWLPTPASGSFTLNLRLYWPKESALDGTWSPPPVKRVTYLH